MDSKLRLREVNAYNKDAINKAAFMPEETEEDNLFSFGGTVEASPRKHTGKLIEVNKGNKAGINKQRENLFFVGGDSRIDYANDQFFGTTPDVTAKNPTNALAHTTGLIGADAMTGTDGFAQSKQANYPSFSDTARRQQTANYITGMYNGLAPVSPVGLTGVTPGKVTINFNSLQPKKKEEEEKGKPNVKQTPFKSAAVKDQYYKDAAALGLSDLAKSYDLEKWDRLASKEFGATYGDVKFSKDGKRLVYDHTLDAYMNGTTKAQGNKSWLGISKKANPFSKGNIGGTMKGIGMAAASIGDQIDTGDPRGLFDTLDPVYHLAGGRESAVGNAMSDAGVALTKSGVPIAMLAGAALKVVGGLTNAAFGIKEDKEMRKRADQSISSNFGFRSNAAAFDDIKGPASMTNTNIYEGGWFSGDKADEKNAQYARDMANAYSWADRSIQNNVRNISADQVEDFMRNYAALGGYFDRSKRKRRRLIKR